MNLKTGEVYLDELSVRREGDGATILWKESDLPRLLGTILERFDHPAPRLTLAVVDLAQVEDLTFGGLAVGQAVGLDDAPVTVFFAVLASLVALEIHGGTQDMGSLGHGKGQGLPHKAIGGALPGDLRRI